MHTVITFIFFLLFFFFGFQLFTKHPVFPGESLSCLIMCFFIWIFPVIGFSFASETEIHMFQDPVPFPHILFFGSCEIPDIHDR